MAGQHSGHESSQRLQDNLSVAGGACTPAGDDRAKRAVGQADSAPVYLVTTRPADGAHVLSVQPGTLRASAGGDDGPSANVRRRAAGGKEEGKAGRNTHAIRRFLPETAHALPIGFSQEPRRASIQAETH